MVSGLGVTGVVVRSLPGFFYYFFSEKSCSSEDRASIALPIKGLGVSGLEVRG